MSVVFKSFDQIEIDGVLAGNIVDVISNHATKRLQVLEAYKTYTDKLNADHVKALQEVQADLATASSQLEAVTQAKTTLEAQVASLLEEKQELKDLYEDCLATVREQDAANDKLQAKVAELETKVVELTPPPKPESVTPAQIRIWLLSNGIDLETVTGMIAAIPDETIRKIAQVRWEYGLVVLRDDPLVQQMGSALGLTVEQMDAAFLAASQIT